MIVHYLISALQTPVAGTGCVGFPRSRMSSARTVNAPSFGDRRGGGARRDRDDDDERGRRERSNTKPVDKISVTGLATDGHLRRLVLLLLEHANLGNLLSGSLLTVSGNAKPLWERTATISAWTNNHLRCSDAVLNSQFSELSVAYVHTVRAIADGGCFDQLVALLVEHLTELALEDYEARH